MNTLKIARIALDAESALDVITRKLGIEQPPHVDLPERAEWRKASDVQRTIWIGEWMRTMAYAMAGELETAPLVPFTPTGGEQYRHQND